MNATQVMGQDPSFSQIDNTRSYSHPSQITLRQGLELEMAHRIQWNNIYGNFTTSFLNAFMQPKRLHMGYGISIMQDKEGAGRLTTQDIRLGFRWILSKNYFDPEVFVFSCYGGFIKKTIDWNKLVFSDQLDPVWGIYSTSDQVKPNSHIPPTFNAGLSFTYKNVLKVNEFRLPSAFSASWHHIQPFKTDESLQNLGSRIPGLLVVSASTTVQALEFYNLPRLHPIIRYEKQKNLKRITYGSLIGLSSEQTESTIYTGVYYSSQFSPFNTFNTNSIICMLGYEKIRNKTLYSVAYSYDINTSGLNNSSSGGVHEITLNIYFNTSNKSFNQPSSIFNRCPK